MRDMPRLRLHDTQSERAGYMAADDVNALVMIAREHNREPGAFDYRFP